MYVLALTYLPKFGSENIYLAELEVARGDLTSAVERLDRIARSRDEAEALTPPAVLSSASATRCVENARFLWRDKATSHLFLIM
jgi:hypothetical protein